MVKPDAKANWINQTENDWDDLLPVADKKTKAAKVASQERAIFKDSFPGVLTGRDDWVTDKSAIQLEGKVKYLINGYNELARSSEKERQKIYESPDIKLSEAMKLATNSKQSIEIKKSKLAQIMYRPFCAPLYYFDTTLSDRLTSNHLNAFGPKGTLRQKFITFVNGSRLDQVAFSGDRVPSYSLLSLDPIQFLTRHRYAPDGTQTDNITDWAFNKFPKPDMRRHHATSCR